MRHLGLRQCLAGCALIFAATSHATTYNIETTSDVAFEEVVRVDDAGEESTYEVRFAEKDGLCSVREAVYASNYQVAVDGCEAGTGSNTIKLVAGETYFLSEGELPISGGLKVRFETIEPDDPDDEPVQQPVDCSDDPCSEDIKLKSEVSFTVALAAFEDPDLDNLPALAPAPSAGPASLFNIQESNSLTVKNMRLGPASDADDPLVCTDSLAVDEGGLIRSSGTVIIAENMTLQNGCAKQGGAIYLAGKGVLSFEKGGRFENNVARENGAVIATSDDFRGGFTGIGFYMAGNAVDPWTAESATIYIAAFVPELDDEGVEEDEPQVQFGLSNGTLANNRSGGIRVERENYASGLLNMTIAFNDGIGLSLEGIPVDPDVDLDEQGPTTHILHSVVVGNEGACDGTALVEEETTRPTAARIEYVITDDPGCVNNMDTGATVNPNTAQSDIFLGKGGIACEVDAEGAGGPEEGGCDPMTAEELDGPYPGYLPNPLPLAVVGVDGVGGDDFAPSLLDRGNPETATTDLCETNDNRGKARAGAGGRCDVGAVEFLRATAQSDEIALISGQSVLADVLENDRNDTWVDCGLVSGFDYDNPSTYPECLDVITTPGRGSAVIEIIRLDTDGEELSSDVDDSEVDRFYPKIRYTPSDNFHGVDQLRYQVSESAFVGGTDTGRGFNDIANLVSEPASGLTEKKSIGAQGAGLLLLLVLVGMLRRHNRALILLITMLSGPVLAKDIVVDVVGDTDNPSPEAQDQSPAIKGDGICTLREALANASGDGNPDCAYGTNSTDRILIPAIEIKLADTLIVDSSVELVGKGVLDDPDDDEDTVTQIIGKGDHRLFEVRPINPQSAHPTVSFQYLTLEGGRAEGAGDSGSGAAILTGGSIIFDRVVIAGNQADESGGVVYVRGNAGNKKLLTFNRTYVHDNHATNGGVLFTTSQNEESIEIAMVDSTFAGNTVAGAGSVLKANIAKGRIEIANSTFFDNEGGAALDLTNSLVNANLMNATFRDNDAGIDLGNGSDAEVKMSNSIYFNSGACTSSVGAEPAELEESFYNAFSSTACAAKSDDPDATNLENVDVAELADMLTDEPGTGTNTNYAPPYLTIEPNGDLVDAGNDEASLAAGASSPLNCRSVDLRGISRTAGGRCDLGAYEYQQITAGDDEGSNAVSSGLRASVDLLDNDLASDGAEIILLDDSVDPVIFKNGIFEFERAKIDDPDADPVVYVGTGEFFVQSAEDPTRFELTYQDGNGDDVVETIDFVWQYYNENRDGYDLHCGDPIPQFIIDANPDVFDDGDVADDCVILYTPPSLVDEPSRPSPAFADSVCSATANAPVKTAFLYRFQDSEGLCSGNASDCSDWANPVDTSDWATVELTINDKPPELESLSRLNDPGQSVEFTLSMSDPDDPGQVVDWEEMWSDGISPPKRRYQVNLVKEPSFSKKDENHNAVGYGIFLDVAGQITYVPEGNYNTFKDTFTVTVEDNKCDVTSKQATFTITYPNDETSAGSGGSLGWAMLGGLILLLRRRVAA
ncbi:hypothetical protein A3754_05445 [Alcanivorax sp. HI0083]|nr:choice-of-anchor Q domain-containing protein [Alcanivorax sp. HI0083]KZZ29222.1 hypothetical protein A3754_05445 [Alcanivorax sp. HI0083]